LPFPKLVYRRLQHQLLLKVPGLLAQVTLAMGILAAEMQVEVETEVVEVSSTSNVEEILTFSGGSGGGDNSEGGGGAGDGGGGQAANQTRRLVKRVECSDALTTYSNLVSYEQQKSP
jgi:hypothetical protein